MFTFAKKKSFSVYTLVNILFEFASRVQDPVVLTYGDILSAKRKNGVASVVIAAQKSKDKRMANASKELIAIVKEL